MFAPLKSVGRRAVLASVVAVLGLPGLGRADDFQPFPDNATHSSAAVAAAIANVPDDAGIVYDESGATDTIQVWNFTTLVYVGPLDVTPTLDRIRLGDSVAGAHPNDGGFFNLRTGELPNIPRLGRDYYIEFVVWPGEDMDFDAGTFDTTANPFGAITFPGPMRLLVGAGGEVYFSGDHYGQGAGLPAYYVNPTGP